jgi:hypothetical protein
MDFRVLQGPWSLCHLWASYSRLALVWDTLVKHVTISSPYLRFPSRLTFIFSCQNPTKTRLHYKDHTLLHTSQIPGLSFRYEGSWGDAHDAEITHESNEPPSFSARATLLYLKTFVSNKYYVVFFPPACTCRNFTSILNEVTALPFSALCLVDEYTFTLTTSSP